MNNIFSTQGMNSQTYNAIESMPAMSPRMPGFGTFTTPLPRNDTFTMSRETMGSLNTTGPAQMGQFNPMDPFNQAGQAAQIPNQMEQMMMNNALMTEAIQVMMMALTQMKQNFTSGGAAGTNNTNGGDTDTSRNNESSDKSNTSDTTDTSHSSALNNALTGGTDLGKRIAKAAEADAAAYNTPGKCLQEAGKVLREFGIPVNRHPAAWQALPDLQNSNKVKEIQVGKAQLDKLPAGAIVVWDKGAGLPYGHISIALGDGREASSKVRNQLHLNTGYHVFVPVG
jgi:hypothetical protein